MSDAVVHEHQTTYRMNYEKVEKVLDIFDASAQIDARKVYSIVIEAGKCTITTAEFVS